MPGHLTDDAIDVAALTAGIADPGCGATVVFLGTVRNSPADGDVLGIEYSAYPAMAEAEFDAILAEASSRWPTARIALQHRVGYIATGEASIAVVTAGPHREEAYAASRYVIEETKKRVPVWKKERCASGEARWTANTVGPARG